MKKKKRVNEDNVEEQVYDLLRKHELIRFKLEQISCGTECPKNTGEITDMIIVCEKIKREVRALKSKIKDNKLKELTYKILNS